MAQGEDYAAFAEALEDGGVGLRDMLDGAIVHDGGGRELPPCSLQESEASSSESETVMYRDIVEEFERGLDCFFEKYCFDQLKAVDVEPDDDLEWAIAQHAKVRLRRNAVYVINHPMVIKHCAYVIGNGATVRLRTQVTPAIRISPLAAGPSIAGMWGVTFCHVKFERDSSDRGLMIRSATHVLLHSCVFSGIMGTCLQLDGGGSLRGCQFLACYRAICCMSTRDIRVRSCYFEKCIFGVTTKGDYKLTGNVSHETYCFAHLEGEGILRNNQVRAPNKWTSACGFSMVTCADGQVTPLGSVHVVSNKTKKWPTFLGNVFVYAQLYLGNRQGTFALPQCAFFNSSVCVDTKAARKLVVGSAFDTTLTVYKVLRRDERCCMKMCVCGASHYASGLVLGSMADEVFPDRARFSADSGEYTSDEE